VQNLNHPFFLIKRRKTPRQFVIVCTVLALCGGCATSNDPRMPRRQITSCPPGQFLVCVSQKPRKPSEGGVDEEIPAYDRCRCDSSI